ncbi:MAG: cytochrome c peroxidase [Methyloglobulus sp.]|nr:c-type cytochrome [Methyloglobulus sp.]
MFFNISRYLGRFKLVGCVVRNFLILLVGLVFSVNALANPNLGLPPLNIPADNPQTAEKIALGKRLFNDKHFSADGTISCASCHQEDKAFTDGLPVAVGINGQAGTRNTPTLINAAFFETLFLDGRASSLEAQVLGPMLNPIEHGLQDQQVIVDLIRQDRSYTEAFRKAFAIKVDEINISHVTKAIASFERTLISGDSLFDRHLFGRDHTALSSSAERGLTIFKNKGNCVTCHEISWNNALFTDNRFYNIGVGFKQLTPVLDKFIAFVRQGNNPDYFPLTAVQRSELGRFNVTKNLADIGKFKTPTLRNIALTAPYMHDGSMKTLEEVIDHYDIGGDQNRFIDSKIFPLHLTTQEKQDLVAFMQALTSSKSPNHPTGE